MWIKDKSCPLVVDIDDTLLTYDDNEGWENPIEKYRTAKPNKEEINTLRILHLEGYEIILHTGRGWDKLNFTVAQMQEFHIPFDHIVMGKPLGIYIDADSKKSLKEFIKC